ncbi:MAG: TonB-dependent receptor [Gammaproteobacteria bacterium]
MKSLPLAVLAAVSNAAMGADELTVQVQRDGIAAEGLEVTLDGEVSQPVGGNGLVVFDLDAGQHSIQVTESGSTLHTFRFSAASDQLADISVDLSDPDSPMVAVESYNTTETAEQLVAAATGSVQGRVTSAGQPVAGATVQLINGLTRTAETDANGEFSLNAPRGIYSLVVSQDGLGRTEVSDFRIVANAILGSDVELRSADVASSAGPMEEVIVVGSALVGGQQDAERFSVEIVDALDYEQIARFGDSDIAASVLRIPAVTLQDDKFVFVRGLGGRYISTSLNGAAMPSTDPSKRTVPLDIFPSSMVEQLDVSKSFIASMSGESTGGEIAIETRTFPNESDGKFSIAIGYRNGLTGSDVLTDPLSGDIDWLGIDDGARNRPPVALGVSHALDAQSAYTTDDLYGPDVRQELGRLGGEAIQNGFDPVRESASPDVAMSVSYGDLYQIDNIDADFGFFVAASLKNDWKQKDEGIRRTYIGAGDELTTLDDFTFVEHSNDIDMHGLLALGLNRGRSSYEANTILTRSTTQSVRREEGIDGDELNPSVRVSLEWEERQYLSQQFSGSHILGERDQWSVDWQGTASRADRYAPDRRDARFDVLDGDGIFDLRSGNLVRRYDELADQNFDISTDVQHVFVDSRSQAAFSFGMHAIDRQRDSDSDSYGFQGGLIGVETDAPNLDVNDVINDDTITGDPSTGFTFQDKTQPSDSYEADMTLNSVYASYDALFADKFQIVLGVRYEDFEQITDTFSPQGAQLPVRSTLADASTLPSLTFNWLGAGDSQIRFSASETVARPDFKETSNATFFDREFNFRVRGNPLLRVSNVRNYDVRWERYFSGQESLSVALFHKDMDNPIERVVQPASGTAGNSRTFQNAEAATVSGLEIDVRKDFSLNESFTKSLYFAANASVIDSEVTLVGGETRALQGAPDYSFNLILGYDDISNGQELTLLFNQSGDTIVDVGISGQPDIIETPRLVVDLNYRYYINDSLTLRIKVEDLLNSDVEFTQGGRVFQKYNVGQRLQAAVEWSF